jgi:hypothetical protein
MWGAAGIDINLDHHRSAPYSNLFTNLYLGWGSRAFAASGAQQLPARRHPTPQCGLWVCVMSDPISSHLAPQAMGAWARTAQQAGRALTLTPQP